jgi:hypothetical protein
MSVGFSRTSGADNNVAIHLSSMQTLKKELTNTFVQSPHNFTSYNAPTLENVLATP